MSRKYAWNAQTGEVKADGSFSFPNLPLGEPLIVGVTAKGLQLDPDRQILQTFQRGEEHALGVFLEDESLDVKIQLMKVPPVASNEG